MTQFGYTPQSSSPARKRIDAIAAAINGGRVGIDELSRRVLELRKTARERQAAEILARRWRSIERYEIGRRLLSLAQSVPLCEPSMPDIVAAVAEKHNLTTFELFKRVKRKDIVEARQEAMWRCYKETSKSLPDIGRYFKRDHTTVLHAIEVVDKRRAEEKAV